MSEGQKRGFTRRAILKAAAATPFAACAPGIIGHADSNGLLLRGGPIYTGTSDSPAEALIVRAGRIAFAGRASDIGSGARALRVIDLKGAAVFPGFVDAHCHLTGIGMRELTLDLTGIQSIAAMQAKLRAYAQEHKEGTIVGRGWIETHWPEKRFPTRADLDAVVADRPVFLERIDGHAAVVNSRMLEIAGISAATKDPAGGRVERDAQGQPTGMLIDNAKDLAEAKLPAAPPALEREALERAVKLYAARGWTGAANMSAENEEIETLTALAVRGALPIRTDHYLEPQDAMQRVLVSGPYEDKTGFVRARGIKVYMDGALGSRGAALLAPYADRPGQTGLLVTPLDQMREVFVQARASGAQVATHAIGDRGNRLTLDGYEAAFADAPEKLRAARWRIEHAQVINPADIPRFGRNGVIASMQPSHCISDMYFAPSRLGKDRLKGAYAWKSLAESGAVLAGGTDAPVEKGDPLIEFYAAVHRHSLDGFASEDWHLEEALSRAQALRMLTWGPAYASFKERELGTLEAGKRADISVFSEDLMTCEPAAAIPKAQAVMTIVDGRIVHSAL